jgi:predicted DNA-binding transcriptional regulator AlpA
MIDDKLLKVNDCIKIIPVARSQFYKLVSQKKLPQPVKIGSGSFWRHSDLQKFIARVGEPPSPTASV